MPRPLAWFLMALPTLMIAVAFWMGVDSGRKRVLPDVRAAESGWGECEARLGSLESTISTEPRPEPEYVLWEVHEVSIRHNARDPRQDGELPALCHSIGDASALRLEAELASYSLWTDGRGVQKLGCRWVKRKEAP